MRFVIKFAVTAAVFATAPAKAQDAVRSADARVAQTRTQLAKAQQSRDAATIAEAKAKYDAAKAVAWGRRNPPKAPANAFATRGQ